MISKNKGFTLIEILVVIGIIAILAAIVIIAINPAKQFAQARNTQRTANVNAILNAIGQRMADNKGVFEGDFDIGSGNYSCPALSSVDEVEEIEEEEDGCLVPTYIAELPSEPTPGGEKYTVELDNGRVKVCAPEAAEEDALPDPAEICVTR